MDIAEFLLARISEDEAVAREAVPSVTRWSVGWERTADRRGVVAHLVIPNDSVDSSGIASDEVARTRWLTTAAHISRHDPARVLAECEAKRRIVAEAREQAPYLGSWGSVLSWLAAPYADHPDYDPAWQDYALA